MSQLQAENQNNAVSKAPEQQNNEDKDMHEQSKKSTSVCLDSSSKCSLSPIGRSTSQLSQRCIELKDKEGR